LRVQTALDDAVAYFTAKGLSDRAADNSERKDGIDQAISTLKVALNATEAIDQILKQMKGLAINAKNSSGAEKANLAAQFNELATQLNNLVLDASYNGVNLVNSTASLMVVQFTEMTTSQFTIYGRELNSSILFNLGAAASVAATTLAQSMWSNAATSDFDAVITAANLAIDTVRGATKAIGSNVSLLQTRLDFSKQLINSLTEGADKLRLADLNEEGANLVALQTRQQLGLQALSMAGQAEQAILTLFR
jgi:flagellin-like hook-associated protein FlgL